MPGFWMDDDQCGIVPPRIFRLYGEIAFGSTSDAREGIAFGSIWNAFGMSRARAIAKGYCEAKNSSSSL